MSHGTREPSAEVIDELRAKYTHNSLFQLTMEDGKVFIVRGSSYDEFSRLAKSSKGNEARLGLKIVQTFVVWPELDMVDMEYNKAGDWEPGLVAALAEKIQEVMGYSKDVAVKKL